MQTATSYSHFLAGRYQDAYTWAQSAIRDRPNFVITMCAAAASGALSGQFADARAIVKELRSLEPQLRLANLAELFPFQRKDDAERWRDGLRKAGLPD